MMHTRQVSDAGALGLALFATDVLLRAAKDSKDSWDDPYVRMWIAAISHQNHDPVVRLVKRLQGISEEGGQPG